MSYYDLPKATRNAVKNKIYKQIFSELSQGRFQQIRLLFSDEDTYLRKLAYQNTAKIFFQYQELQDKILGTLETLIRELDFKIRQTVINTAGEIGKIEFPRVRHFFDSALFDVHHAPRNAVIGSIKKMAEVNPEPVLQWAAKYLHHPDKEVRREICHGIELRGRKHPEDILPMLKELQFDREARVRNTLIHVLGQIAYKQGCLKKVLVHLRQWENKELVRVALDEIIDVHNRYRNFAAMSQESAIQMISENLS